MSPLYVIKKDGRREKFERTKIKNGLLKALEKRPITNEKIEEILDSIEEEIRRMGKEEIDSETIGEVVMNALKKIDQVAYIRFASVYRSFTDVALFEKEIKSLNELKREEITT
jgi:transcriptional repressor NrdR